MIAILAALTLAAAPLSGRRYCKLSHPEKCEDTNELVWDNAFERAVGLFVGRRRRANYIFRGRVADQIITVLGGPPHDAARIGDLYLFTACRQHSCIEKGAAVVEPNGVLVALAILHDTCGQSETEDCDIHHTLTIFVKNTNAAAPVVKNLSDWAMTAVKAFHLPSLPQDVLDGVEVISTSKQTLDPVSKSR